MKRKQKISNATSTTIELLPPAAVYGSTAVVERVDGLDEAVEGSEEAEEAAEGVDNSVEGTNVDALDEVEIEPNADHCSTTPLPQAIALSRYTKVSPNQLIPISQDCFDVTGFRNPKRAGKPTAAGISITRSFGSYLC